MRLFRHNQGLGGLGLDDAFLLDSGDFVGKHASVAGLFILGIRLPVLLVGTIGGH